jgi:hypothetical protein
MSLSYTTPASLLRNALPLHPPDPLPNRLAPTSLYALPPPSSLLTLAAECPSYLSHTAASHPPNALCRCNPPDP